MHHEAITVLLPYDANDVLSALRRALWNLTKQRPSTAPVGNDALMAALRQLGSHRGEDLAVWKFMSAGDLSKSPSHGKVMSDTCAV